MTDANLSDPDLIRQILLQLPLLTFGITFVFGAIIGSFLNVVVYRLPIMMRRDWESQARNILESSLERLLELVPPQGRHEARELIGLTTPTAPPTFNLILPNSHCPACNHEIRPWENIPILSYLFLGGRCSSCHSTISLRYPLVELATALLSCVVISVLTPGLTGLVALVFTWMLICMSLIDFDHKLLPDQLTLGLLWLGLSANYFGLFVEFSSAFWGAVMGYLVLWLVYWGFKLVTGKEGMGYGDFKLLAALGAWAGWQSLPLIIILSSLAGSLLGGALLLLGRDRDHPIPFGPYLAIAGFVALLWGDSINHWYLEWSMSGA